MADAPAAPVVIVVIVIVVSSWRVALA